MPNEQPVQRRLPDEERTKRKTQPRVPRPIRRPDEHHPDAERPPAG